ncbi:hypothetical protein JQC67_08160 [Aurantibacter crassamenti]|uniref:lipid-binding protein n=1 Tax=Aurantibacter crassamenti TaxID=1837375 RepID=UPI001939929B|nr:lipid-binding protein [Aurantibacter crassamenti]MBM1106105.1 hypothetical protein [Aurantibacter crassamenti]
MNYNIILKKLSYLFLSFALISSFVSCEKVESVPDESDIAIGALTGTWVVNIDVDGETAAEDILITTYNTAANSTDSMWLDDLEHYYGLKAKVNLDFNSMTFSGTDLDELHFEVKVNITEGTITKGGATTPSGEVVDSISFNAEFSDSPGVIFKHYGYKSTAKIIDLP